MTTPRFPLKERLDTHREFCSYGRASALSKLGSNPIINYENVYWVLDRWGIPRVCRVLSYMDHPGLYELLHKLDNQRWQPRNSWPRHKICHVATCAFVAYWEEYYRTP